MCLEMSFVTIGTFVITVDYVVFSVWQLVGCETVSCRVCLSQCCRCPTEWLSVWLLSLAEVMEVACCCFRSCNLLRYIILTQKHTAWKNECSFLGGVSCCFRQNLGSPPLLRSIPFPSVLSNADSCGLACTSLILLCCVVWVFVFFWQSSHCFPLDCIKVGFLN